MAKCPKSTSLNSDDGDDRGDDVGMCRAPTKRKHADQISEKRVMWRQIITGRNLLLSHKNTAFPSAKTDAKTKGRQGKSVTPQKIVYSILQQVLKKSKLKMSLESLFNLERPHLLASRLENWADVEISAKKIIKIYKHNLANSMLKKLRGKNVVRN